MKLNCFVYDVLENRIIVAHWHHLIVWSELSETGNGVVLAWMLNALWNWLFTMLHSVTLIEVKHMLLSQGPSTWAAYICCIDAPILIPVLVLMLLLVIPYTENIWLGKILANHEGKSYWQGKIWRKATVSAYVIYVFRISVNIGEECFSEWLTICQICQIFPLPIFSWVQYLFALVRL